MRDVDPRRTSGILLLIGFALHLGGVLIFNGRFFLGWFTDTGGWFTWERSLFIAAYATAAVGAGVLGSIVRQAERTVAGRLSASSRWIGRVVAVWSVVWLVVLVGVAAEDIYSPILHFLPLLFVGIGCSVVVSRLHRDRERICYMPR